jgi:D-alanyl-D-alanine carboxypeptidase
MRQGKNVENWTSKEFQAIGNWIDKQLKERQVWVTLMPNSQESSVFMRSLSSVPNWKTGYTDNTQHMLIDTDSEQGKILIAAILEGTARFPDIISRSLTTTTAIYENNYVQRTNDLYAIAKEGFDTFPYPAVTIALTRTSGVPAFRENITNDLKAYLEDFTRNQDAYQKQHGYLLRLPTLNLHPVPASTKYWISEKFLH